MSTPLYIDYRKADFVKWYGPARPFGLTQEYPIPFPCCFRVHAAVLFIRQFGAKELYRLAIPAQQAYENTPSGASTPTPRYCDGCGGDGFGSDDSSRTARPNERSRFDADEQHRKPGGFSDGALSDDDSQEDHEGWDADAFGLKMELASAYDSGSMLKETTRKE